MFLVYKDNPQFDGPNEFNPNRFDPNKMMRYHLKNYFFLKFILMNSDDTVEKHRASKELDVCERKMKFWQNHYAFCEDEYEIDLEDMKKDWNMA